MRQSRATPSSFSIPFLSAPFFASQFRRIWEHSTTAVTKSSSFNTVSFPGDSDFVEDLS